MKRTTADLRIDAQAFVREAVSQCSGRKPSEQAIKKAANKIVQALRPVITLSPIVSKEPAEHGL